MTTADSDPALEEQISAIIASLDSLRRDFGDFRSQALKQGLEAPHEVADGLLGIQSRLNELHKTIKALEEERVNLEALAGISKVINSSLDLTTVLNEVMDTIISLTGAERAFLMLRDAQGEMDIVVARNWEKESLDPAAYGISTTIVDRVLANAEPILTTNASADPRFGKQASIVAHNLRSILCVPLKVKGKLTGVIYADNRVREGLFTQSDCSLLAAFGDQAAVALENAMLFASVQRSLEEVTELKTMMEDVFASIASGVITTDIRDRITLVNRAAVNIFRMSEEDLLGSSVKDLLAPLSPELPQKLSDVKTMDQRYVGLEIQASLKERGDLDLNLNMTPLKTADRSTLGVAIVFEDQTEKRRLQAQRRLFSRMVSPAVIEQLDPDSLKLGGSRMEITTLFADIRGFTSFSAKTDPETLVEVLNEFLAVAAEAVLSEAGTIDKYAGDAVMAWFNAPAPQPDHTLRAVRAALAMQGAVKRLREQKEPPFRLSFGVGIHVGEALLGLIGTQRRLDYTAIGNSVNIAKRLQENAAPDQVLVSKRVAVRIKEWVNLQEIPPFMAEGKKEPLEAYAVLGLI